MQQAKSQTQSIIQNIIYDIYHPNLFLSSAADPNLCPLDFGSVVVHILQHLSCHLHTFLAHMAAHLAYDRLLVGAEGNSLAEEADRLLEGYGALVWEGTVHVKVECHPSKEEQIHVADSHPSKEEESRVADIRPAKKDCHLCVVGRDPVH